MKRFILSLLLLAAPLTVFAEVVLFAGNVAQADIPAQYKHYLEQQGQTLVVSPANGPRIEMRFTFNSLRSYVKLRPTVGKDFVLDSSKKKGRRTFEVPENGGVGFVDFSQVGEYDGEKVQETHGIMGLDDGYVTFTVSIPEAQAASPAARQALDSDFKLILGRIRSRAP